MLNKWTIPRLATLLVIAITFIGLFSESVNGGSFFRLFFWAFLIPVMVLIIFFMPLLWRNICPLATTNLFNFNFFGRKKLEKIGLKANELKGWQKDVHEFLRRKGVVISALLFWLIVPMRLFSFYTNSFATLLVLGSIFAAAFIMGFLFPVKSGWCTSICPIFSTERTYGMNPMKYIRNQRCDYKDKKTGKTLTCSGCSFNCIDTIDPEHMYWMENLSKTYHDTWNARIRKFFVGSLPGFIIAYFGLTQVLNKVSTGAIYSIIFLSMIISYSTYVSIKYVFRFKLVKRTGELNLDHPNSDYALHKRRLDLSFATASFLIFWFFSVYNVVFFIFNTNFIWMFVGFVPVFVLTIIGARRSWNEKPGPHNYRTSWW